MPRPINHKSILGDEKGMVLAVTLMMIAALILLGTTAVTTVTTDIKIAANYREGQKALYNAEAGVEQVIVYLRTPRTPPFTYPTAGTPIPPITVSCPTGFNFNTSVVINYVAPNWYRFQMIGTGANNASKTIEAYIRKVPMYPQGADGAVAMYGGGPEVNLKSGANPQENYSIDGQDYPVPTNANCNGSACSMSPDTTLPALPGLYTVQAPTIHGTQSYLNGNPDSTIGPSHEPEWNSFVNDAINNSWYQTTMGTRANPAVTLVQSGTILAGSYNGAGIIIVQDGGEVRLAGNGCFEGIIILRGTGKVTGVGTNNVYGTIITIGHTSKLITATGVVNMYYSSAALANLANINSITQVRRTAWRDVF